MFLAYLVHLDIRLRNSLMFNANEMTLIWKYRGNINHFEIVLKCMRALYKQK